MNPFFCLVVFFLGACVGSFLNSIIYRLNTKEGFLTGHSHCPKCNHELSWKDLVPIFSFLILKGKCRYCKEKISFQYPLVEIATAILFVLIANYELGIMNYGFFDFAIILNSLFLILNSCFLIVIFVYDLKHYIIPDRIIYPAIGTVFLYQVIFNFQFSIFNEFSIPNFQTTNFYSSILSAFGASIFFLFIYLISKGAWMGFGDVKLAFFMGLFLGFPDIMVALSLAFFIGAFVGIILIILGKKTLKSQVPFAPFLIIGTFLSLLWGETLIGASHFLLL